MNKSEVLEIRKQYNIKHCNINRIAGCYVNGQKEIIAKFNESLLSKPEEEIFKYLEIFKKGLSGGIGKNIRTLDMPDNDTSKALMALVRSELKEESVLDAVYDKIIESISDKPDNFLILFMQNAYDVPNRNLDNLKDGESDEVYSYVTCYLCPVKTEKPGLAFNASTGKFEQKELRHCIEMPEFSFVYPSFEDRSTDTDKVTVYTKSAGNDYDGVIRDYLGCGADLSAEEQKKLFSEIIEQAVAVSDTEDHIEVIKKVNEKIAEKVEETGVETKLAAEDIKSIFEENHISTACVDEMAGDNSFTADVISSPDMDIKMEGISVKVKSDVTDRVERRVIDGKECLIIAINGEPLTINGTVFG